MEENVHKFCKSANNFLLNFHFSILLIIGLEVKIKGCTYLKNVQKGEKVHCSQQTSDLCSNAARLFMFSAITALELKIHNFIAGRMTQLSDCNWMSPLYCIHAYTVVKHELTSLDLKCIIIYCFSKAYTVVES